MPRSIQALGFLFVTTLGLYGCAKPAKDVSEAEPAPPTVKAQKIEVDFRAAVVARDQARQKLAAAEEEHAKIQGELRRQLEQARAAAAAEKDALAFEVKARTGERDAVNAQYEAFRKNLKDLLGTADTSAGSLGLPAAKPPADQGARK